MKKKSYNILLDPVPKQNNVEKFDFLIINIAKCRGRGCLSFGWLVDGEHYMGYLVLFVLSINPTCKSATMLLS